MTKLTVHRILKILFLTFGFIFAFVISTLASYALLNGSLEGFLNRALISLCASVIVTLVSIFFTGLYSFSLRHASIIELIKVAITTVLLFVSNIIITLVEKNTTIDFDFISCIFFFVLASAIVCS